MNDFYLDIMGQQWHVKEGDQEVEDLASTEFSTNTITIRPGLLRDRYLATVWHEIMHVFLFQLGNFLPDKHEERVAQGLGHAMRAFLHDNDVIGDLT